MRKLALLSLVLFVPIAFATAAVSAKEKPVRGARGTVWVTERTPASSSVAAFDAATGDVLGWTPVGSTPIGIVVPRRQRLRLFVRRGRRPAVGDLAGRRSRS